MKYHPMDINTNTRVRWEVIKKIPELSAMSGKTVLDIGSGLGYFSLQFAKCGAKVLCVDRDKKSLNYLKEHWSIDTEYIDLNNNHLPSGKFNLIFIGEVLEHINDPLRLFKESSERLSPSGMLLVTTPALEGPFIYSRGKMLGHTEGSEKHLRHGFMRDEIEQMLEITGFEIKYHSFSVFNLAELFMQLTKRMFLTKKKSYKSQSDVLSVSAGMKFKAFRVVFHLLLMLFKIEHKISVLLKLNGHCHIFLAVKR